MPKPPPHKKWQQQWQPMQHMSCIKASQCKHIEPNMEEILPQCIQHFKQTQTRTTEKNQIKQHHPCLPTTVPSINSSWTLGHTDQEQLYKRPSTHACLVQQCKCLIDNEWLCWAKRTPSWAAKTQCVNNMPAITQPGSPSTSHKNTHWTDPQGTFQSNNSDVQNHTH